MTTLDERHGEGARDGDGRRGAVRSGPVEAYGTVGPAHVPPAVPLEQPVAAVPLTAGSKAANLARAARAGLPVLPGFVIPHGAANDHATDGTALRRAWHELSDGGTLPLVVRSSSPQEDTEESSLAGQFASVLDVRGWAAFRTAVGTVLDSARRPDGSTAPMAVLVQPMLAARVGGVMFGADPVEGRTDRILVSAVRGGPDSLVSGEQAGTNHWLSRNGRLLRTEPPETGAPLEADPGPLLTRAELLRLARLARRARRVFGGPQDIEFGFDGDGRLWLFQSRPITAMAVRPARGARLLGPGPVAETLPEQLAPLEEDLWVAPMARGLAAALDIGGSAPRRLLRTVPVVMTVGGRAAADLRLLGAVPPRHRWLALLNPAPGARRLGSAWRVGRLGVALPGLATDLVADVDARLARIPAPSALDSPALTAELRWTRAVLVSLHAQEALAGALLPEPRDRDKDHRTAAGTALVALSGARARGVPEERIIATHPVVLALTAPSVRNPGRLPAVAPGAGTAVREQGRDGGDMQWARVEQQAETAVPGQQAETAVPGQQSEAAAEHRSGRDPAHGTALFVAGRPAAHRSAAPALPPRESLRLRIRWVQELQVRLIREAARRLGLDAERLALLRWKELAEALYGAPLPGDLAERLPAPGSPPLPDAFRLAEGTVVAERREDAGGRRGKGTGGRGVSGGRAAGTVWDGSGTRPRDAVLVVRTLDPALAPLLPGLTALVAQTGSPLSHLAVLAREFGVPTVVGASDAVRRFPPGSRLTVDGTTGDVQVEDVP